MVNIMTYLEPILFEQARYYVPVSIPLYQKLKAPFNNEKNSTIFLAKQKQEASALQCTSQTSLDG